ncbi:MAG: hypothetical protein H6948_06555 [Zoogloeaceae bacterium]|nr:hypothetical protein [Zoogloeaceae bacterium]
MNWEFSMACPKCNSTEWKLASLIHKEGLAHVNIATKGAGVAVSTSGVGAGGGGGTSVGTQQSQLSIEAAPPGGLQLTSAFGLVGLISVTLGLFVSGWFLIGFVICTAGALSTYPTEKKRFDAARAKWEVTRMCTRCGTFYQPTE